MTRDQFKIGARVVINRPIDIFPIGVFQPGLTGAVTHADPDARHDIVAHVKLDLHFAGLEAWANELQVWDIATVTECDIDAFTIIDR
jgi:hypothetical protein